MLLRRGRRQRDPASSLQLVFDVAVRVARSPVRRERLRDALDEGPPRVMLRRSVLPAAMLGAATGACLKDVPVPNAADAGMDARPSCDASKEPKDEPCWVQEAFGIFVSPQGDDA